MAYYLGVNGKWTERDFRMDDLDNKNVIFFTK